MAEKMPWEETYIKEDKMPWEETYTQGPKTSALEAGFGGAVQGASFGFGEELAGVGEALLNPPLTGIAEINLPDDLKTKDTRTLKERYQEGRDSARARNKLLSEEHPVAYIGGQVAGAIPGSLLGAAGAKGASLLARAGVEGAAFGLGTSEADLTEGELKESLKDTAIGAAIGVGTAGIGMGISKVASKTKSGVKKGFEKFFGEGGKSLPEDAAGDILELTPKQRKDATLNIVKTGPGQPVSTVAEELPGYLKEKGGFLQSTRVLRNAAKKDLENSGAEIDSVLNSYDDVVKSLKAKNVNQGAEAIGANEQMANQFSNENAFQFNELANKLQQSADNLRTHVGSESQVAKLDKYIEGLRNYRSESTGGNFIDSIKELHQYRKDTDRLIKSFINAKPESAEALVQDALLKTRRDMSTHIQDTMLGNVKDFSRKQFEAGNITQDEFNNLLSLQDRIYKANKTYKLSSFVDGQIEQAIGRKDSRKLAGLTDWILGAASTPITGPYGVAAVAAKKTGEYLRPKVQLYAPEIGQAVGNFGAGIVKGAEALRTPVTQQAVNVEDAVRHKVLMSRDPEYRKKYLKQEN